MTPSCAACEGLTCESLGYISQTDHTKNLTAALTAIQDTHNSDVASASCSSYMSQSDHKKECTAKFAVCETTCSEGLKTACEKRPPSTYVQVNAQKPTCVTHLSLSSPQPGQPHYTKAINDHKFVSKQDCDKNLEQVYPLKHYETDDSTSLKHPVPPSMYEALIVDEANSMWKLSSIQPDADTNPYNAFGWSCYDSTNKTYTLPNKDYLTIVQHDVDSDGLFPCLGSTGSYMGSRMTYKCALWSENNIKATANEKSDKLITSQAAVDLSYVCPPNSELKCVNPSSGVEPAHGEAFCGNKPFHWDSKNKQMWWESGVQVGDGNDVKWSFQCLQKVDGKNTTHQVDINGITPNISNASITVVDPPMTVADQCLQSTDYPMCDYHTYVPKKIKDACYCGDRDNAGNMW